MTGEFPSDAPIERIRRHLVGLRMPRALETLDHLVAQIERGQLGTNRGYRDAARRRTHHP